MNNVKVIKTALERIGELMDADPAEGTPEADELEVLALLVDRYEEERFPIGTPDPVEAIRFRMDQMGLRNTDLVPYVGFGIPADVLIQDPGRLETGQSALASNRFPLSDMRKRGYHGV